MASRGLLQAIGKSVLNNVEESMGKIWQGMEALAGCEEPKIMLDVLDGKRLPLDDGKRMPLDLAPSILWADEDCRKLEDRKKLGPVCKSPDLRKKPLPPYQYGYCKEIEPELPMSCPPKIKKQTKGPCCHEEVAQTKGGCRNN